MGEQFENEKMTQDLLSKMKTEKGTRVKLEWIVYFLDPLASYPTTDMSDECETLLYMAARAQLVEEVIIPSLNNGKIILCDRFLDSTIAYQGYGNGVDVEKIKGIGEFATQGVKPDLTFLFDLDVDEGFARINRPRDRIENRSVDYHNRVKSGYLEIS